jgi:hypothetical protein
MCKEGVIGARPCSFRNVIAIKRPAFGRGWGTNLLLAVEIMSHLLPHNTYYVNQFGKSINPLMNITAVEVSKLTATVRNRNRQ